MKSKRKLFVFFGIDGSGKTTLIREVEKRLERGGAKVEKFYMGLGSSHYFIPLKWIMALRAKRNLEKTGGDGKTWRDHNYRERGFFWVFGQYCELWLRYLHARRIAKKKIILFDRYFYDGLVLGNKFTYNFFKYLTPKPTRSFLIKAPAKIIRSRKKEAEIKHIDRYYLKSRWLYSYFNIIEVDNTKKIGEVVDKLMEQIND